MSLKQIEKNIREFSREEYENTSEEYENTLEKIKELDEEILRNFDSESWKRGIKFNLGNEAFNEISKEQYLGTGQLILYQILDHIPEEYNYLVVKEISYYEREYYDEDYEINVYIYSSILLMDPLSRICFNFRFKRQIFPNEIKTFTSFNEDKNVEILLYLLKKCYFKSICDVNKIIEITKKITFTNKNYLDFSYIFPGKKINEKCIEFNEAIKKLYEPYFGNDNINLEKQTPFIYDSFIAEYKRVVLFFKKMCLLNLEPSLKDLDKIIEKLLYLNQMIKEETLDPEITKMTSYIEEFISFIQNFFLEGDEFSSSFHN